MVYFPLFAFLSLFSSTEGGTLQRFEALNQTTRAMTDVSPGKSSTRPLPYLQLPVFVDSRLPLVEKRHFSPSRGSGLEPLPEPVREILLPERLDESPISPSGVSVKTSCKMNKMRVEVPKSMLGTGEPHSGLRLGTCRTSKSTRDYIYFEYEFGLCGSKYAVSFLSLREC